MRTHLELLISLYDLYSEGKLKSEFNKTKNKMEDSPELISIMEDVYGVIPEKKSPKEAAAAMRELSEVDRNEAIEASEGKVVDLRSAFARKIAVNGGVQGLVKELLLAANANDQETLQKVLLDLGTFVNYDNGAE